ncbi:MAG: helix-turn-helix domain-containing protein [Pseudobdellovibrionaceae bacterium]|nr:MAG: helix-turn-helix domain-containing protein [Pseudobdellovibrionaceae bacterium]
MDLTQQELANKSKLSMATIHKIEQGRSEDMKFSVLEALGKGLGEKDPLQLLKKPE